MYWAVWAGGESLCPDVGSRPSCRESVEATVGPAGMGVTLERRGFLDMGTVLRTQNYSQKCLRASNQKIENYSQPLDFLSKKKGASCEGRLERCMACARASHKRRVRLGWCELSVRAACCSAVTRPLGLALRASLRNEARAVESHPGSDDRNLSTVLLSAISSRSFMYVSAFACAFRCMRVAMRARSSPMYHGAS